MDNEGHVDKEDIVNYIWKISDKSELRNIWNIIAQRSKQLEQQQTMNFAIGDKVKWDSKRGYEIEGIVIKLNRQSVSVRTETQGIWKVSSSLLIKV